MGARENGDTNDFEIARRMLEEARRLDEAAKKQAEKDKK